MSVEMCVAEDVLRGVALGRTAAFEVHHIVRHVSECERCRRRLRELRDRVEAARFAVNLISPAVAFCQLHHTADGLVRLWAKSAGAGIWQAGCHGPGLDVASNFSSAPEAVRHAAATFATLFPDHTCSFACCTAAPGHPEEPQITM